MNSQFDQTPPLVSHGYLRIHYNGETTSIHVAYLSSVLAREPPCTNMLMNATSACVGAMQNLFVFVRCAAFALAVNEPPPQPTTISIAVRPYWHWHVAAKWLLGYIDGSFKACLKAWNLIGTWLRKNFIASHIALIRSTSAQDRLSPCDWSHGVQTGAGESGTH